MKSYIIKLNETELKEITVGLENLYDRLLDSKNEGNLKRAESLESLISKILKARRELQKTNN